MRMFIPGHGTVDTDAYKVDCAVKQHDDRLFFSRNENTGDWCIFIRMPSPEPPYPVLGFGSTVPSVDAAMNRLKQADTMRNGEAIYNDVVKSQEKYRKALQYQSDQAAEESAEPIEFMMRKEGKSPVVKVFYNKGGDASDN